MGFEMSYREKIQGRNCCSDKWVVSSRHEHSTSCSDFKSNHTAEDLLGFLDVEQFDDEKPTFAMETATEFQKKPVNGKGIQNSMRREILQLEERLQDQFSMRRTLEKALGFGNSTFETEDEGIMPKPTKELIREISVLELEVMHLERYLLSLYRKAYDQQVSTISPRKEHQNPCFPNPESLKEFPCKDSRTPPSKSKSYMFEECSRSRTRTRQEQTIEPSWKLEGSLSNKSRATACTEMLGRPVVQRSHSELSQRAVSSAVASFYDAGFTGASAHLSGPDTHRSYSALSEQAVRSALLTSLDESTDDSTFICHSEPLSSEEGNTPASQIISLAEFLGTRIADHVPETPNRVSEDMIRCIGSIFCKLAEPPLVHPCASSSTTSSFSSTSAVSPQYLGDSWSPVCKKDASFDSKLENPFRLKGLKELSGPYNTLIEVSSICSDTDRLRDVEDLLRTFKSLLHRLEKVDPRKMKHEEKLAFWINVHNALVMHAYVEYGTPQNYLKRLAMVQKVTCKVGGRVVNVNTIRSSILCHRMQYPGQWMRAFLSPKMKLRGRDDWQAFAIEHAEPLLHFALCSGSYSDPVVRIYSPKRVYKMLETAKEEFIRATVSIRKEEKIFLPKLLDSYARESNLTSAETLEIVRRYLPETLKIAIRRCQIGRTHKCIEWVPHNFDFRYLLLRELNGPMLN